MNIIQRLRWSLGRGNPVVPSRLQATASNRLTPVPLPLVFARRTRIFRLPGARDHNHAQIIHCRLFSG